MTDSGGSRLVTTCNQQKGLLYKAYHTWLELLYASYCNLLRPLIKMLFLMVPYGYIIIKTTKNS